MNGREDIVAREPEVADDEIDLVELFGTIWAGRWLVGLVTAAVVGLGAFYCWAVPRSYTADAMVQVELKGSSVDAALGDLAAALGSPTPVTAEIEIITSRLVVGKVVDRLRLDLFAQPRWFPVVGQAVWRGYAPEQEGAVRAAPLGLRHYAWGGERIDLGDLELPASWQGTPLTLRVRDGGFTLISPEGRELAAGAVGERVRFVVDGEPASMFVRDLVAAPGTEFRVAQKPRTLVIDELRKQLQASEKGRQSGIISVSLEGPDPVRVTDILNELVTAYQRQNVERRSEEAEKTLAFLREQLPQLRAKLEAAEQQLNSYRLRQGSADLTKETELILQRSVQLEQARIELEQKREEALRRFTPEHPVVTALDAQIAQIDEERKRLSDRIQALPETQQELLRLAREVEVNTALYTALLNSAQELEVVKAGTVGNVRIIDYAVRPLEPSSPKVALVMVLSLLLGGMLGVIAVFVRRALHAGVADPAVVERALGMPVYGEVPYSEVQRRFARELKRRGRSNSEPMLLAERVPDDLAIEALRSLRTALHFAMLDAPNNIVMVTGPAPGLGKTFLAANLGAVLATAGKRVLVIDADLRRGHLNRNAGVPQVPGLSDYIAGDATLEQVVHPLPVDGLHLITKGTTPPNPAELLLNPRLAELMQTASAQYDTVLVDTPPILAVADAGIVGRLAGTTLLLLKAGEHPLRMIEDATKRLRAAGVNVRGVVMNQVGAAGQYSYYGRYGYKYYRYEYKARN